MVDLETLSQLLAINETQMVQDLVSTVMSSPQISQFMHEHPLFFKNIQEHVQQWSQAMPAQMKSIPVPDDLQQEYILFLETQGLSPEQFSKQSTRLLVQLQHSDFHTDAQNLLLSLGQSNLLNRKQLFIQKWREHLVSRVLSLEIDFAEQERERMLQELELRMQIAGELDETLAPQHPGKLWDLTATHMLQGNSALFRHYASFLVNNPELKKIADALGRAATQDSSAEEQITQVETPEWKYVQQEQVPDDLVGVHQSNELNRLISSETVLLTEPELETVFYKQLAERRLLNYQFMGQSKSLETTLSERRVFGETEDTKGPFIVCIDTSGSMSGYPEDCAKGFCFALLQIALSEQRHCVILLFSTDVVTYELTGPDGLQEALNFLSCSFKGGTDLEPCMHQVMNYMQQAQFRNADAVVLSDFIAQRLSPETEQQAYRIKQNGNRFNAVSLSRHGKPALMKIFDNVWKFDTSLSGRMLRKVR
ncbi:ATPase RavA stimulator ViaA [Tolumonas lignilytica]|uniref:ATPase RavA stimulator ViaA n=1 Tax=Tolumonas lignilytica TaxID=1283284 RepID=UPI000465E74B|nr:ATPase RavA stimulator ViaA [Tolumonas lignilytica]